MVVVGWAFHFFPCFIFLSSLSYSFILFFFSLTWFCNFLTTWKDLVTNNLLFSNLSLENLEFLPIKSKKKKKRRCGIRSEVWHPKFWSDIFLFILIITILKDSGTRNWDDSENQKWIKKYQRRRTYSCTCHQVKWQLQSRQAWKEQNIL